MRRLSDARAAVAAVALLTALVAVATTAAPSAATSAAAPGCAGTTVLAGPHALLVRRAGQGDRAELTACPRGPGRRVALGATYGDGITTNARARSTLVGRAIGGPVVAAGFEVLVNGCLYAHGCGAAPRQVLRVADTRAATLRRIPLHGSLSTVSVSTDGRVTFSVDEYACLSAYRTTARPGDAIELLRRVPARAAQPGGAPLCAAPVR